MKTVHLDLPTFAFIVSTRGALGVGIGLLLAGRLTPEQRRRIGRTLIAIGAASTLPSAMAVIRSLRRSTHQTLSSPVTRDERLIGTTRFPRKGDDDDMA